MNIFRTAETPRPIHLDYPMALLDMDLSAMEMLVYMLLLNRSNLSARSADWQDGMGRVFVYYPIHSLAEALRRSEAGVKKALNALEKKDLILRRRQGRDKHSRIYVKLPPPSEISPSDQRKTGAERAGKPTLGGPENRRWEVYESSP